MSPSTDLVLLITRIFDSSGRMDEMSITLTGESTEENKRSRGGSV